MAVFVFVRKDEEKKTKKLSQFLKSHISGMLKRFRSNLVCGVGGCVHSKIIVL